MTEVLRPRSDSASKRLQGTDESPCRCKTGAGDARRGFFGERRHVQRGWSNERGGDRFYGMNGRAILLEQETEGRPVIQRDALRGLRYP